MQKIIMKTNPLIFILYGIIYLLPSKIYSQAIQKENNIKLEAAQTVPSDSKRIFIDKFIIPLQSKPEFIERLNVNRNFIKKLPGFINDSVYERMDEQGNLVCVTIAVWASEESMQNAKAAVQSEYKKEGFNLQAMLQRLNITMVERGVYTVLE
ncbi:MAG TPA: hypothetical protein VIT44_18390 [Cyclobacteriaceae bacterium]